MTMSYPKWSELPDIDLYLDQVLLYVNQIGEANHQNEKGLTASMINNYVKHGHLEKPIKKKYSRKQVARLIVISQTLAILTADNQSQKRYDDFVACMNGEKIDDLPPVVVSACQTLQLYYQTHQLVQELEGEKDEC